MRSEKVLNLTAKRSLELLKGATLWRAFINVPNESSSMREHTRFRNWANKFEEKENISDSMLHKILADILEAAYKGSLKIAAEKGE